MSSSAADIQSKIDAIDVQIDILIASPDEFVSYSEGARNIQKKGKLDGLLALREHYVSLLSSMPSEDIEDFAVEVDRYGQDASVYVGDE